MTSAMSSLKSNGFWRVLYMVLLGQSVSFSMALMSFSSSLFANLGVDAPFTLAFLSYLALNLVFGSVLLYRRQKLNVRYPCLLLICRYLRSKYASSPQFFLPFDKCNREFRNVVSQYLDII